MSIEDPAVIPLAVVTAFGLFLLKEIVEAYRRWSANKRKLGAIKALVAAECERNNYTYSRLLMAKESMSEALIAGSTIEIVHPYTGRERLRIHKDNGTHSGFPIPKVHTEALEKYLFETASLDAILFAKMRNAQDSLAEIQHVRDGFVKYPIEEMEHIDGFLPWSERYLNEHIEPVRDLYFSIEYEPLTKTRLR